MKNIVSRLLKIADELDDEGSSELAKEIDEVAQALVEEEPVDMAVEIAKALDDAEESGYLAQTLAQRNPSSPSKAGSTFLSDMTVADLKNANWEPYSHPDIKPPAMGFKADIPGTVGIVALEELDPGTPVMLTDPKSTHGTEGGGFSAEVIMSGDNLPKSGHTTMLLGPGRSGEIALWTIFPGDPTGASIVGTTENSPIKPSNPESFRVWQEIPASEALEQGFKFAKVVEKYSEKPTKLASKHRKW